MDKPKKPSTSRRTKGAGSIHERDGALYARLNFTDAAGKRKAIERKAKNRGDAERLLREMHHELSQPVKVPVPTFRVVAAQYKEKKLIPPEYNGETRIRGLRSWKEQRGYLPPLLAYFTDQRIDKITYEQIADYRQSRFNLTRRGVMRSVAHVNRELSLLRSIFNFAKRSGLLDKSPFEMGEGLITLADEVKRDRLLSFDEEKRLLAVCIGPRRHLRAIIIAAIDTAMRKGELFKLKWSAVEMEKKAITIRKTTTKTWQARNVAITARLLVELTELQAERVNDFVFGGITDVKRAFATACRLAEIKDLRFHDLRHAGITRMILAGLVPGEVMKLSGHERFETFARYLNINADSLTRATNLLDRLHADHSHYAHTIRLASARKDAA